MSDAFIDAPYIYSFIMDRIPDVAIIEKNNMHYFREGDLSLKNILIHSLKIRYIPIYLRAVLLSENFGSPQQDG